jgi:hypothetical protein
VNLEDFIKHKEAIIREAERRTDLRIKAALSGEPEPEFESMPELNELAYFA